MCPLMLYEVTTSAVECLERMISRHLRRWLGVPPSFTSIGLYGRTNQLQLPLSSLVEEFKVAKTRLAMTLKQSQDSSIQSVCFVIGRSWVRSPTASYQRRYKNSTRCFLAWRSAYKDKSGSSSLLSNLVKKEMNTIRNERSRVINISWDNLFRNRP